MVLDRKKMTPLQGGLSDIQTGLKATGGPGWAGPQPLEICWPVRDSSLQMGPRQRLHPKAKSPGAKVCVRPRGPAGRTAQLLHELCRHPRPSPFP